MKKIQEFFKNLSYVAIIVSLLFSMVLITFYKFWNHPEKVIQHDMVSYYGYLPATFIYKDWKFEFVDKNNGKHKLIIWTMFTQEGKRVLKTTMGLSFLYMPFFLIAHLLAHLLGYDTGGYSEPYVNLLLLSSIFYLFIGLYFLRKILLNHFSETIVALTLIVISCGTNLLFYTTLEAIMSHVYSFALFVVFIYYTHLWHHKVSWKYTFILGFIYGLLVLIRATNALIAVYFILYGVYHWNTFKNKILLYLKHFFHILTIGCLTVLVWVPQLLYWKIATGNYFYYAYQDEVFFFSNPQILNVLFSYRKGLFIYTPMMFFAYLGIIFLYQAKLKDYRFAIPIFLIINIYVISSWWCWWYGGSLGNRAFIESYAFCAIPLAAFFEKSFSQKFLKWVTLSLTSFLIFLQVFQLHQFYLSNFEHNTMLFHYDSMSKKAFWSTFLRLKQPEDFWQILDIIDYEHAKLGIFVNIEQSDKMFKEAKHIICDAEEVHPKNKFFLKTNFIQYGALSPSLRTKEKAFSGNYSICLDTLKRGGFTMTLPRVFEGEQFLVRVKTFTQDKKVLLVMESPFSSFKVPCNEIQDIPNSDWKQIEYKLSVPKQLNGINLRLNCYNYGDFPAYFDDLEIQRIQ